MDYISRYLEHGDHDFLPSKDLTNANKNAFSRGVVKNSLSLKIKKMQTDSPI